MTVPPAASPPRSSDVFGAVGVWISRRVDPDERQAIVSSARSWGYGTIWLSGGLAPGVFDDLRAILDGSESITVATSVLNIWAEPAERCAEQFHQLETDYPGRLYLGMGVSHAPAINASDLGTYTKPLAKMRSYLDALDAHATPVPVDRRMIGALGPRMLELAVDRTRGSVPYLVSPQHTAFARQALGIAPVLAPEVGVVLDVDVERGRATARDALAMYLGMPNYTNNFQRFGFGPADLEHGGSDALIDAVFAVGDVDDVFARADAHRAAGADHVAYQVIPRAGQSMVDVFEALAPRRM